MLHFDKTLYIYTTVYIHDNVYTKLDQRLLW